MFDSIPNYLDIFALWNVHSAARRSYTSHQQTQRDMPSTFFLLTTTLTRHCPASFLAEAACKQWQPNTTAVFNHSPCCDGGPLGWNQPDWVSLDDNTDECQGWHSSQDLQQDFRHDPVEAVWHGIVRHPTGGQQHCPPGHLWNLWRMRRATAVVCQFWRYMENNLLFGFHSLFSVGFVFEVLPGLVVDYTIRSIYCVECTLVGKKLT